MWEERLYECGQGLKELDPEGKSEAHIQTKTLQASWSSHSSKIKKTWCSTCCGGSTQPPSTLPPLSEIVSGESGFPTSAADTHKPSLPASPGRGSHTLRPPALAKEGDPGGTDSPVDVHARVQGQNSNENQGSRLPDQADASTG